MRTACKGRRCDGLSNRLFIGSGISSRSPFHMTGVQHHPGYRCDSVTHLNLNQCYHHHQRRMSSSSSSSTTSSTPPPPVAASSSSSPEKKTVVDEWKDDAFAQRWTDVGAVQTNPDRHRQLSLLGSLARSTVDSITEKKRYAATSVNNPHRLRQKNRQCVLDFGCGSALSTREIENAMLSPHNTEIISSDDVEVVGIDNSAAMLKIANESTAPSLRTRLVDIETMDDATVDGLLNELIQDPAGVTTAEYFSCVTYSQVLHELPYALKRKALEIAHRHLHPDGAVLVLDRYTYDPRSRFAADYRGIWNFMLKQQQEQKKPQSESTRSSTSSPADSAAATTSWTAVEEKVENEGNDGVYDDHYTWEAYNRKYMDVKLDHTMSEGDFRQLMEEVGFDTEMVYKSFNRCLIAGRKKK